eukprot:IDg19112t1
MCQRGFLWLLDIDNKMILSILPKDLLVAHCVHELQDTRTKATCILQCKTTVGGLRERAGRATSKGCTTVKNPKTKGVGGGSSAKAALGG